MPNLLGEVAYVNHFLLIVVGTLLIATCIIGFVGAANGNCCLLLAVSFHLFFNYMENSAVCLDFGDHSCSSVEYRHISLLFFQLVPRMACWPSPIYSSRAVLSEPQRRRQGGGPGPTEVQVLRFKILP